MTLAESLTGFDNSNDKSKAQTLKFNYSNESEDDTKCEQHSENGSLANAPGSSAMGGFNLKDDSLEHSNQLSLPLIQVDNS